MEGLASEAAYRFGEGSDFPYIVYHLSFLALQEFSKPSRANLQRRWGHLDLREQEGLHG